MNLDRKGIEVDSLLCPMCHEDIETVNHTFFNCEFAKDLWSHLAKWWNLDIPFCSNIEDWFVWLDHARINAYIRLVLEGMGECLCGLFGITEISFFLLILLIGRLFYGIFLFRNPFYGFLLEILSSNLAG